MCDTHDETINHLLLMCKIESKIWRMCDKWTVKHSIHHSLVQEHFLGFEFVGLRKVITFGVLCE